MFISIKSLLKIILIVVFLIMTLFVRISLSQEPYPIKPIIVVVNFGAGGAMDIFTRAICKVAEKELGQSIIIENKPGATGMIGMNYVLKSKPDGYTLGTCSIPELIVTPHMQQYPFNVLTDVTDIFPFFKFNFGLSVRSDAPWNTFEDLIAYSKMNPGKFTYSTPGVGSTMHIITERIAMKEGIKWTAIPFKSGGEAVLACLGGHTEGVPQPPATTYSHMKAGKLKLLLVLSDTRWPEFPNIPTILEKGYDFYAMSYGSVYGPKGMTEPIRQKLEDVFKKSMKDQAFMEIVKRNLMGIPHFNSGKEYSEFWKSKYVEMEKVLKALGLVGK